MNSYASKKWGNLREALHTGEWHTAKGTLYNVMADGEEGLLSEMITYYKAWRDHKYTGRACWVDELNIYKVSNKGRATYKKDLDLLLSTGVIWSDSSGCPAANFWSQICKFKPAMSAEAWEDWCVGRDTLIVVPVVTSTKELESLFCNGHMFEGLVKTVRLISSDEDTRQRIEGAMPFAQVLMEEY